MTPTNTITDVRRTISSTADTVGNAARDTLYAGLGIVAVAQEEFSRVFDTFVSEGRKVESGRSSTKTAHLYKDAREEVKVTRTAVRESATQTEAMVEDAAEDAAVSVKTLEERVSKIIEDVLQRMNVPTRKDVDALKRSVERLDRKTSELRSV
jgi:poly(hydroxyalkanoate) granule-associated protein